MTYTLFASNGQELVILIRLASKDFDAPSLLKGPKWLKEILWKYFKIYTNVVLFSKLKHSPWGHAFETFV